MLRHRFFSFTLNVMLIFCYRSVFLLFVLWTIFFLSSAPMKISSLAPVCHLDTNTHTHTYIHTHTHTYIHTHTHTRKYTDTHTHTTLHEFTLSYHIPTISHFLFRSNFFSLDSNSSRSSTFFLHHCGRRTWVGDTHVL
jgi:hypothetical protein